MSDAAVLEKKPAARRGRPPKKKAPPLDRVTAFATDVLAGEIIAGPHVRNACARHLRDLKDADGRGLVWSAELAAERIAFFEEVLCLNGGDFEGKPFTEPSQQMVAWAWRI